MPDGPDPMIGVARPARRCRLRGVTCCFRGESADRSSGSAIRGPPAPCSVGADRSEGARRQPGAVLWASRASAACRASVPVCRITGTHWRTTRAVADPRVAAAAIAAPPRFTVRTDRSGQRNRVAVAGSAHGFHSPPNSWDAERRRRIGAASRVGRGRGVQEPQGIGAPGARGVRPWVRAGFSSGGELRGGASGAGAEGRDFASRASARGGRRPAGGSLRAGCGGVGGSGSGGSGFGAIAAAGVERRTAVGVDGVGRARTSARRRGPCGSVVAVSDLQRPRGVGRGGLRRVRRRARPGSAGTRRRGRGTWITWRQ